MRVLSIGNMYPPHHLGGYELVWRSAVEHMRRNGHDVRVLTTDYRRPDAVLDHGEDPDVHRELRWYWRDHEFPRLALRDRVMLEHHNARVLQRHVAEFGPDAVNWWAMGGMSLSLIERVRRAGVPASGVVGDEWMAYGLRVDAWTRAWRGRSHIGALAERATGIPTSLDLDAAGSWLFNSDVTRRRSIAAGWRLARASVVHPGVDHRLFRPHPREPWLGRLLYVGRIDPRKGIDTAIRALGLLPPDVTLTVLGPGDDDHLADLRDVAIESGVHQRVLFSKVPRAELPSRYGRADALLFPVRWDEPWGLVPLEAMATGLPVVATGTGGSAEYLRHEDNCLLFSPRDDPEALAGAVRRLGADDDLRRRLSAAGLATAAKFREVDYNDAILEALEEARATRERGAQEELRA